MSEDFLEVECRLSDCLHFQADPERRGFALCQHPDKCNYLAARPCPLYRLDWQKKVASAQSILRTFGRKQG